MHTHSLALVMTPDQGEAYIVEGGCISITGEDERGAAVKQSSCGGQVANCLPANFSAAQRQCPVPACVPFITHVRLYLLQADSQADHTAERHNQLLQVNSQP